MALYEIELRREVMIRKWQEGRVEVQAENRQQAEEMAALAMEDAVASGDSEWEDDEPWANEDEDDMGLEPTIHYVCRLDGWDDDEEEAEAPAGEEV
jgi:hypothetical protein